MNKSVNRLEWIDIAKGIGMILVILGHCVAFGGKIHNLIFAFHMPLFFCLSGIVFKEYSIKENIIKKTKSLLAPYVYFCVVGALITLAIPEWRASLGLKDVLKDMYLGNPNCFQVSSVWFLIALFWVSILYNLLVKIDFKMRLIIIIALLLVGFGFSIVNINFLPSYRLPLNLDVALIALFFFWFGTITKLMIERMAIISFLLIGIVFIATMIINGRVNLHGLTFNNPFLYIIESLSGTITLLFVVRKIKGKNAIRNGLTYIGKNTLIILGTQALLIRLYILVINHIGSYKYELYGLPKLHQVFSFITVTILSIMICMLVNKIKEKVRCI